MSHKQRRSPLHISVMEEQIKVVADLINKGANVNEKDLYGITPLHLAVESRHIGILKLLLKSGAEIYANDGKLKYDVHLEDRNTPLEMAIKSNNKSVIKCFLDFMGDVNETNPLGLTPLHQAAVWGNLKTLQLLVKAGANVNAKDHFKRTPLMKACQLTNNINILKFLIDAGANVNARDTHGCAPLHYTSELFNVQMTKILIDAGADVNALDQEECTPAHEVAENGCSEVFRLLISSGADIDARDEDDNTPLLKAIKSKNFKIVKAILDSGANINVVNSNDGYNPLHLAIRSRSLDTVKLLIEAGANLNIADFKHNTPIHRAINQNYMDVLKLLICAGASVNEYNKSKETPLMCLFRTLLSKELIDEKLVENLKLLLESTDLNLINKNKTNILRSFLETVLEIPEKELLYKIILEHIAKLMTLKLPVDKTLLKTILETNKYKSYYVQCMQELETARETFYQNSSVTVFNLLVDSETKLMKYARNSHFIRSFIKCKKSFPIYGAMMQDNVAEGCTACEFFGNASSTLSYNLPVLNGLRLIVTDILDSLTKEDWKKLSEKKRYNKS